jgi:hypothetical protein
MDHRRAVDRVLGYEFPDPLPEFIVSIGPLLIPPGETIQFKDPAGPPMLQSVLLD